jgi:hypothetical protein
MMLTHWLLACTDRSIDPKPRDGLDDPDDTVPTSVESEACSACGGDCVLETLTYRAAYHVTGGVDYADPPPAGGPHDPCWVPFGVHQDPIPDENWVHNLEHGAIVVLHDADECDADCTTGIESLETFVADRPWGLSTPYEALDVPFAALAWGFRMSMGCDDLEAVGSFYDTHFDQGPESVLAGPPATCP